jgi:hypothetical protein
VRIVGYQTLTGGCCCHLVRLIYDNFVGGGIRNILVIGADALSQFVDWTDRGTCILFGDAAGAVLVQVFVTFAEISICFPLSTKLLLRTKYERPMLKLVFIDHCWANMIIYILQLYSGTHCTQSFASYLIHSFSGMQCWWRWLARFLRSKWWQRTKVWLLLIFNWDHISATMSY